MLNRLANTCLLRPQDIPPSQNMKVVGVFNPGAAEINGEVVLTVRVAEAPKEVRPGFTGLPRWEFSPSSTEGTIAVDWFPDDELAAEDVRVVVTKANGLKRLTSVSHLRVVRSPDGMAVDESAVAESSRIVPAEHYESYGIEDPRITKIDDTYYVTYVAVSEHGASTALASTDDFVSFRRHGIVFPPENKDVVLFPARIDGKYWAMHRPNPNQHFHHPEIWTARSDDMALWGRHEPLPPPGSRREDDHAGWRTGRIGAGCPPVMTADGWLAIYHGNDKTPDSPTDDVGVYSAGALLLDGEDPRKILKRSRGPVMAPETHFERQGFVPNVVFPTGIVERPESWLVYYGAADSAVGMVEFSKDELLGELTSVS